MGTAEDVVVTERDAGSRIDVFVKPRASRSAVVGARNGALEVAVAAPPVEGAANEELRILLAEVLGVRRSDVVVAGGAATRSKRIDVAGLGADELRARLRRLL
jgi:hypothetical protein